MVTDAEADGVGAGGQPRSPAASYTDHATGVHPPELRDARRPPALQFLIVAVTLTVATPASTISKLTCGGAPGGAEAGKLSLLTRGVRAGEIAFGGADPPEDATAVPAAGAAAPPVRRPRPGRREP